MKNLIIGLIIGFILGTIITTAFAVYISEEEIFNKVFDIDNITLRIRGQ